MEGWVSGQADAWMSRQLNSIPFLGSSLPRVGKDHKVIFVALGQSPTS